MCAVPLPKRLRAGRGKIQLRFQKRSLAAEEPANFNNRRFLRKSTKQSFLEIAVLTTVISGLKIISNLHRFIFVGTNFLR
jgi:hypothetical protein